MALNRIQTTTGTATPAELGRTLVHEHVLVGFPGWELDARAPKFLRAEAMALPLNQLHQGRLQPMQKRAYDAGEESGKRTRYQWALLPLLVLLLWEIAMAGGRSR